MALDGGYLGRGMLPTHPVCSLQVGLKQRLRREVLRHGESHHMREKGRKNESAYFRRPPLSVWSWSLRVGDYFTSFPSPTMQQPGITGVYY